MLIINRTEKIKKYQIPKKPNFENARNEIIWLKQQKMEAELINIKGIYIQVKDINQMIYSRSMRMVSLYAQYQRLRSNIKHSDEDYILINKTQKGNSEAFNKELIYDIIKSDWILKAYEVENMSSKELELEISDLDTKIQKLKSKFNDSGLHKADINNRIKLLEYKKSCLANCLSYSMNDSKKISKIKEEY